MSAFIAAAAIGGLNVGFNYAQQKSAIRAANRYNKRMRNSEVIGLMHRNRGRTTQQQQLEQQNAHEKINVQIERLQAQGAARAAGASSGLSGRGLENIIRTINEQANRALSTLDANFKNSRASYHEEIAGNQFSANSRIESQLQKPKFSWMSTLQSGLSGAVSGYQLGKGLGSTPKDGGTTPTRNAGVSLLTIAK